MQDMRGAVSRIVVTAFEAGRHVGIHEGKQIARNEYGTKLAEMFTQFNREMHTAAASGSSAVSAYADAKESGQDRANTQVGSGTITAPSIQVSAAGTVIRARAAKGSVEPRVMEVLKDVYPDGLTAPEVTAKVREKGNVAVKQPSVRGKLNALKKRGVTVKRGSKWYLVRDPNENREDESSP